MSTNLDLDECFELVMQLVDQAGEVGNQTAASSLTMIFGF